MTKAHKWEHLPLGSSHLHLRKTAEEVRQVPKHLRKKFVQAKGITTHDGVQTVSPDRWYKKQKDYGARVLRKACDEFNLSPVLTKKGKREARRHGVDPDASDPFAANRGGENDADAEGEGDPESTPEPEPVTSSEPDTFPLDGAHRVATMARNAVETGELSVEFGVRKLIMWGRSYQILRSEGAGHKAALSGSFDLSVREKTYGDDVQFLTDAFQSVFGHDPVDVTDHIQPEDDTAHPVEPVVRPFIRVGLPVWLYGRAGTGKDHMVRRISDQLGRPYLRVQGSGDAHPDALVGAMGAKDGTTLFEYGPLARAMRSGAILVLNEVARYPDETLMILQAVLEGEPLVIAENGGEHIFPSDGFCIVAADNTRGLGEDPQYVGARPVDSAFRDRFIFHQIGYLPEGVEKRAVRQNLNDHAQDHGLTLG